MDNLDKLTATGLPIADLNSEYLSRTDWAATPLGPRENWPACLKCLVYSIASFPHAAAIWWGDDLRIIHNLAWGKNQGDLDGQGVPAWEAYSGEAITTLNSAVRGRTVKVGKHTSRVFLPKLPDGGPGSTILISTVMDDTGKRQGALAQFFPSPELGKPMPFPGFDEIDPPKHASASQLKISGVQQTGEKDSKQVDYRQTELFQRFAELLPTGLAILDSDAEAVFVNDGFFKLTTNRSAKEFRAWPESIDSRDYERVMAEYRKAFSLREELQVEFRCTSDSKDKEEWRLFLLRPLSQEPEAGFICALVDITDIKNAQIAQEKAATEAQERKEQQERFIDMVSHEIRNPLSAVMHLAEEIKGITNEIEVAHPDTKQKVFDITDAANTILLCVSHQNTLVDDILSFSKLDSMMLTLAPREVQPKWEFSKALKVFNSEFKAKEIEFHYSMDPSYDTEKVDHVLADINRMKQVLVNLVTNAIKFTSKKAGTRRIAVSMGASASRPESYPPNVVFFQGAEDNFHLDSTLTAEWGNGPTLYLMVAIKDTGIGISKEDQAKLFERFRQATPKTQENYGGSGLGLFISRKLVQLHGGDIGVSSKEGEGSTFAFFFRVRGSNGLCEGGIPLHRALSRASSDSKMQRPRPTPRPGYNRHHSHLGNMREKNEKIERPSLVPLKSENDPPQIRSRVSENEGVDTDPMNASIKNPPTEAETDASPEATDDARYQETAGVMRQMSEKRDRDVAAAGADSKIASGKAFPFEHHNPNNLDSGKSKSEGQDGQMVAKDSHPTLLLVEDNLINQRVLRRQLQSRGFEVITANNGQEAIDAVRERGKASPDPKSPTPGPNNAKTYFDCILMDQEMPIKDGNAATVEIRGLQEDGLAGRSPILGVSANVRAAQTRSMIEAGMDAVISKPFKVEELERRIRGMIEGGEGHGHEKGEGEGK